jgi:hypothetical protein
MRWAGVRPRVAILREADWGPEFPQFDGKLNALPGLSVPGNRAVTINGAYQMHQQKITGSLKKGQARRPGRPQPEHHQGPEGRDRQH